MYFGATGRLSRDASKWATKILPALASFTSNCDSSLVCQNKTRQAGGGGGALVNGLYLQKLPRHLWIGQRGVNIHLTKTIVYSGLHKLWYPVVRDRSTWSKFGAHGEHGDVFLFSNLGALWFSENLIRYSLHVCLREVKNNLFSFKHSYLRHFSWRF